MEAKTSALLEPADSREKQKGISSFSFAWQLFPGFSEWPSHRSPSNHPEHERWYTDRFIRPLPRTSWITVARTEHGLRPSGSYQ